MVDFLKLRADLTEQYGLEDEDWNKIIKKTILTFTLDVQGRITSTYKGMHVIKHRESEKDINLGETWVCSLQHMGTYYFAKGLYRIDSSFILGLNSEQMDEIASCVWEKHKNIIEPRLKEMYDKEAGEKMTEATDKIKKEYESKIAALDDQLKQLEHRDAANKTIIDSLQNQLDAVNTGKEHTAAAATAERLPADMPVPYPFPSVRVSVRRDGPDSIYSDSFIKSRYFVHLSHDRRTMLVRAHDEGNVLCMNNRIVLEGLSSISSFSAQYDMVSEYNPRYGGTLIYL